MSSNVLWKIFALATLTALFNLGVGQDLVASFAPHTRVLFQGDSITDMNRGRTDDPNHLLGHSYAFLIGAKAASTYPDRKVEFINRGVSGNRVSDLQTRWQDDTIALKPDILSILIGVNDLDSGVPAAEFEAAYDRLLDQTTAALPNTRIVLCEPFGLPTGRKQAIWTTYGPALVERQAIVARLAEKHHALLVRFQHVFDEACLRAPANHWIWDGIHPTFAGQQLLADEWIKTVNAMYGDPLLTPSRNSAISPEVNRERDSYDWLHRHDDILDAQKKLLPEVVLIGDSITHFWSGNMDGSHANGPKAWTATFAGVPTLNMGCGWDRTQNVLWRLGHGELQDCRPRVIVLNIGTNNLVGDQTARENTPEETSEGIHQVVAELERRLPGTPIILMAVFPRGFELHNKLDQRITQLNVLLKSWSIGTPNVTFLDIGPSLRAPDGSVTKEIMFDGTHPTEVGYKIWGDALKKTGLLPASSSK